MIKSKRKALAAAAALGIWEPGQDLPIFAGCDAALIEARRRNRKGSVDVLARRAALAEQIAAHAEQGQIGIWWEATDCDHCRAAGFDIIPAQPMALEQWVYKFYRNAEGPQSWSLAAPSEAAEGVHDVRDLAFEAFEDGHPHVIYS